MIQNSFPRSWYPLCKSSELRSEQLLEVNAFGARVVVFRTRSGRIAAMQARCSHMGANLARGRVKGERVLCPLHEWEYNHEGMCERIPASAHVPANARQASMSCMERYGLVFGFLGGPPDFEFPTFNESDNSIFSQAFDMEFDAPYQVLAANSFDSQHFTSVHHRRLTRKPELASQSPFHLAVEFDAIVEGNQTHDRVLRAIGVRSVALRANCWGGNNILAYNASTRARILFTILPITATRSRLFVLNVLPAGSGLPFKAIKRLKLMIMHGLTVAFLRPDVAALRDLRFEIGVLLPDADASFLAWLQYWRRLPQAALDGFDA